jgi:VWFA-related protein
MRATVAALVVLVAAALASDAWVPLAGVSLSAQQSDQVPIFRSGVEVLEVDVSVVDGKGVPIRDLRAPEFIVTIDGQPRRVVSAEFLTEAVAPAAQPPQRIDPYISNNNDRRAGRLIMLAVDRNNIDTNTVRTALPGVRSFFAGLSPTDRVGLVTIPAPGPTVDFTTNHQQVLDAMARVIGRDDSLPSRFDISDYEALVFDDRSDVITVQRLLIRTCGDTDPTTLSNCDRDVEQEAMTIAQYIRRQTSESVSGLSAVLRSLADVQGAKSLIVLSQGLMLEGAQAESSALAVLAAEARVSVNVLLFDTVRGAASAPRVASTNSQDRVLREYGLESFASRSRGSLFRVLANPQYIFDRIGSEISGYYMLGVEPVERDRDGKPHQIKVEVRRQGTSVRARQQFQYAVKGTNALSRDVLMGRVLRSASSNTELPVRMTTYVYRDPTPGKVKLIMAAEIEPAAGDGALDLAMGFALFDDQGKLAGSGQERKIYSPNSDLPVRYELTLAVDPGNYRLRFATIDLAGNSGSVERDVQAFRMSGQEFAVGDLILSRARDAQGGGFRPPVTLTVDDGQLAAYTELYTDKAGGLEGAEVVFEIADNAESPALRSDVAELREHPDGTFRQAMAMVPVGALPPGPYVARAVVSMGGKTVGKLSRPFLVLPPSRAAVPEPAPAGGAPVPAPAAAASTAAAAVATSGIMVGTRPLPFDRADVLKPEMLRAVYDAMDKTHPSAKGALARARSGKLEGTALMALDAGDQGAGSILRGLEFLSKGQLDPAATQFGVALRSTADSPIASFFLGACFAAAGRDQDAVAAWERARAAQLQMPNLQAVLADGWLRLGQPARAVDLLGDVLDQQPQNDAVRRNLAIAQSQLGLHEQAYPTIVPYLQKNPTDADALMVALHALYQLHAEGRSIDTPEQDRARAAEYAKAYAAANGPMQALVAKWTEVIAK